MTNAKRFCEITTHKLAWKSVSEINELEPWFWGQEEDNVSSVSDNGNQDIVVEFWDKSCASWDNDFQVWKEEIK